MQNTAKGALVGLAVAVVAMASIGVAVLSVPAAAFFFLPVAGVCAGVGALVGTMLELSRQRVLLSAGCGLGDAPEAPLSDLRITAAVIAVAVTLIVMMLAALVVVA